MKRSYYLLMAGLLCTIFSLHYCATPPKDPHAVAAQLFQAHCQSCHGPAAEGFIRREWKMGNSREEIMASITNGNHDAGMSSFSTLLKPEEIASLADYILVRMTDTLGSQFDSLGSVFTAGKVTVKLDTVVADLKNPWGMVFLPTGDFLLTDRSGMFYRITPDKQKFTISGGPVVKEKGQGGLLDVILHPQFASNNVIYLSYSKPHPKDTNLSTTAVFRATLKGDVLENGQDIFVAEPYQKTSHHFGCRMAFDTAGYLFVGIGDRGQHLSLLPQNLRTDMGKIHRMYDDGRPVEDNPFFGMDTARATIWTYGHRNMQGLVFHPESKQLWETEHGPKGGDEVNFIEKGKNYGWPVISYGINYDGTVLTPYTEKEGMEQPHIYWLPSIGPCGMTFNTSDRYPAWKGDLLVGSMSFQYLQRCRVESGKIVKQEKVLEGIGRIREIEISPDGYIYIAKELPGYVFKLIPVEQPVM